LPKVTVVLDLGGVAGAGTRAPDTPGVTDKGPIDVSDTELREAAWAQWQSEPEQMCVICTEETEQVSPYATLLIDS
jgi:hypothetical protein